MTNAYAWVQSKLYTLGQVVEDEQGAEMVQLVGIMASVAALLAVLLELMGGAGGTEISELVVEKVVTFINKFN